jgi:hypothetical protein
MAFTETAAGAESSPADNGREAGFTALVFAYEKKSCQQKRMQIQIYP